jgi:hypothetical protein
METMPFAISETAHAMRKAFDRRAVGLELRYQWKVLFRLTRQPGLRQIESLTCSTSTITLSRIIDWLEEATRSEWPT